MGLLEELLKDAERFVIPGAPSGGGNLDHVVSVVNRVLNDRFADVLKGRRIQVRPEHDPRLCVWHLKASLVLEVPFHLSVAEEVLKTGDARALTHLAANEATKLSEHLVQEIARMLGPRPGAPAPKPPIPKPVAKTFSIFDPAIYREPLRTWREWLDNLAATRVNITLEHARHEYDQYVRDWQEANQDTPGVADVAEIIAQANQLHELDAQPIPAMPFGKDD